jgi:hypothetical protein
LRLIEAALRGRKPKIENPYGVQQVAHHTSPKQFDSDTFCTPSVLRNITYKDLVEKLAVLSITETPENIANKISRGKFTAVFLIQCMEAIGCTTMRLD